MAIRIGLAKVAGTFSKNWWELPNKEGSDDRVFSPSIKMVFDRTEERIRRELKKARTSGIRIKIKPFKTQRGDTHGF